MSASLFELAYTWLGSGPGVPKFTLPIEHTPTRLHRFGDVLGNIPQDSLMLKFPLADQLRAPVNGMLRRVPSNVQGLQWWPVLKLFDGAPLAPDEHDLLLEVWPSAFRRLEYVFSSLEVPTSLEGSELPQAPAPRWFWIRGVGAGIETPAQTIANAQFAGSSINIDVANFLDGRAPLYVAAGDGLTTFDPDDEIEIRVFDGNGLILDPDYVFFTFRRLAEDSDFQRLYVEWSTSIADWNPLPRRHVLVFSDKKGAPYVSRSDPDAPQEPPPIVPPRTLLAGSETITIPSHGVAIINDGSPAYASLASAAFVELALPGVHQRISLVPHGTLGNTAKASFSEYSFFRVQVVDLARWFPLNPNPRNQLLGPDGLHRYTDGNEVIPLIDGRRTFRAWYRAIRATYAVETYASDHYIPALDPNATIGDPDPEDKALAKILMCHAWLESECAFLGRRAMQTAPRVQAGFDPEEDFPGAATVLGSLRVVGALPQPGLPDDEADENRRRWWLLYTPAAGDPALPPGAYVEIRQLGFLEDFRGDDPRLPGDELTADVFGILAPLDPSAPTSWGFVSTESRVLLPALFGDDDTPTAILRVVIWTGEGEEPDRIDWTGAVKGQRRARIRRGHAAAARRADDTAHVLAYRRESVPRYPSRVRRRTRTRDRGARGECAHRACAGGRVERADGRVVRQRFRRELRADSHHRRAVRAARQDPRRLLDYSRRRSRCVRRFLRAGSDRCHAALWRRAGTSDGAHRHTARRHLLRHRHARPRLAQLRRPGRRSGVRDAGRTGEHRRIDQRAERTGHPRSDRTA
ncbi:MAG: hypothetical protein ACXW3E_06970 [Thermoanaerobaculia bacterium]